MAGFTKVLLLPVTIIPKTASYGLNAITYGATGAFNTFASLGGGGGGGGSTPRATSTPTNETPGFVTTPLEPTSNAWNDVTEPTTPVVASSSSSRSKSHFDRMQLLLSLDVALQLIQADRDCLKRIQTFIRYPGIYGTKVREAIEEVFIQCLKVLGEKHVVPGFQNAIKQMENYKPEEHTGQDEVAPLVQFFELVHIGDTIQQMVDVYYEKEMVSDYFRIFSKLSKLISRKTLFE